LGLGLIQRGDGAALSLQCFFFFGKRDLQDGLFLLKLMSALGKIKQ
jgi:hypothetical protein